MIRPHATIHAVRAALQPGDTITVTELVHRFDVAWSTAQDTLTRMAELGEADISAGPTPPRGGPTPRLYTYNPKETT